MNTNSVKKKKKNHDNVIERWRNEMKSKNNNNNNNHLLRVGVATSPQQRENGLFEWSVITRHAKDCGSLRPIFLFFLSFFPPSNR